MPNVPAPVPLIIPPLAMPEALKPKPPEEGLKAWLKFKLLMLVEAKVELPVTFSSPESVKAVAEALPKLEVAVAVMEVKDGLADKLI